MNRRARRALRVLAGRAARRKAEEAAELAELAELEGLKIKLRSFLHRAGPPPFEAAKWILVADCRAALFVANFEALTGLVEASERALTNLTGLKTELTGALKSMVQSIPKGGVMTLSLSTGASFVAEAFGFEGDMNAADPSAWEAARFIHAEDVARLINSRGGRA